MSKITIEEVDNGYIVTSPNPMQEGTIRTVFSYKEYPEEDEANVCAEMLNFVAREVKQYDKYGKYNVVVSVEKGSKCEEPTRILLSAGVRKLEEPEIKAFIDGLSK